MVHRIAHPEDVLREAQLLYPQKFKEVSESGFMDEFYKKAARMPGVMEAVKSGGGKAVVFDVASGTGRVGNFIKFLSHMDFDYYCFEINEKQLGWEGWKKAVIGDISHLRAEDKAADVVFMLNVPIPISGIKNHLLEGGRLDHTKKGMLEMLDLAIDAQYKLNLLEGARVLKDDGIIVVGGKYVGQKQEGMQGNLADLPLRIKHFEVVDVDEDAVPAWRRYGIDIEKPTFLLYSLKKTGEVSKELVSFYEQVRYTALEQLIRIEGFDDIMEGMRKARKAC